jgi:hypothetical protein
MATEQELRDFNVAAMQRRIRELETAMNLVVDRLGETKRDTDSIKLRLTGVDLDVNDLRIAQQTAAAQFPADALDADDDTQRAFHCQQTAADEVYCYGGRLTIHGLQPTATIIVAADTLTLDSNACWVCVRHQWGTSTATLVVVGGSDKPSGDNTFLVYALRRFTLQNGTIYGTSNSDIAHDGDIDLVNPIQSG